MSIEQITQKYDNLKSNVDIQSVLYSRILNIQNFKIALIDNSGLQTGQEPKKVCELNDFFGYQSDVYDLLFSEAKKRLNQARQELDEFEKKFEGIEI